MKNFLAIYIGSSSSPQKANWDKLDEAARKDRMTAGMKAWGNWMNAHKDAIIATGTPLGKTKRTSSAGVADTRNDMTAYVVVQAETHEEAARLFENHPHFTIFPGDSVEIMECLPIPGQ
jgi:ribosomal protein S17